MTSMSDSLMACQPRMLDPSKPTPSSKTDSSNASAGMVKCCHKPGKSMNRRSTARTSFSRMRARTSLGVTVVEPPPDGALAPSLMMACLPHRRSASLARPQCRARERLKVYPMGSLYKPGGETPGTILCSYELQGYVEELTRFDQPEAQQHRPARSASAGPPPPVARTRGW